MKCWICGDAATTGEHRIKQSDLKYLYPDITPEAPLYYRRDGIQKRPIRSLKSDHLKFDALLCANCNNTRTQAFDKAWETLSGYLSTNWNEILKTNKINLLDVFPDNTIEKMIKVQLYFVKIFGTKIAESYAPIDLSSFLKSILENKEHPNIYMSFRDSEIEGKGSYCSFSDIEIYTEKDTHNIIYAHMFYTLNKVTIDLIYCPDNKFICDLDLNGGFIPTQTVDNMVKISKLNYKSTLPEYVQSIMTNYGGINKK